MRGYARSLQNLSVLTLGLPMLTSQELDVGQSSSPSFHRAVQATEGDLS